MGICFHLGNPDEVIGQFLTKNFLDFHTTTILLILAVLKNIGIKSLGNLGKTESQAIVCFGKGFWVNLRNYS